MSAITARTLITRALQNLGVLADGEIGTASQMNDSLSVLNAMLQSWCVKTLLTTSKIGESFSLVALQNSYDIGPTYGAPPVVSDFTTSKPITITSAAIIDSSFTMTEVKIVSIEEILSISTNLTDFGRPTKLVYDPGASQQVGHVGTIYLFPTPDIVYTLGIESEKPFTEIATLDTLVTFPPSYERAIIFNLAIELYPQYPRLNGINPVIIKIADDALRVLEVINSNTKKTTSDLGLPKTGRTNILNG